MDHGPDQSAERNYGGHSTLFLTHMYSKVGPAHSQSGGRETWTGTT